MASFRKTGPCADVGSPGAELRNEAKFLRQAGTCIFVLFNVKRHKNDAADVEAVSDL